MTTKPGVAALPASTGGRALLLLGLGPLLMSGCTPRPPPPPQPDPHFVLGKPYQAHGVWYYPKDSFDLDETGIAAIAPGDASRLTTDGEIFDQTALAAAHPTVQLPAIARLTNLENGRQVTVRLNDRGSGDPHRLVEVTRRTATLLGIVAHDVARVRLRVLPVESHAAADAVPGAPSLAITMAPRGPVEVAELAPPPGVRQDSGRMLASFGVVGSAAPALAAPPLRLPEVVEQTPPYLGRLMVRLDTFEEQQYAAVQRARMGADVAHIVPVFEGRTRRFRVEVGPLEDLARADAVLDQALAAGVPDARIVVD